MKNILKNKFVYILGLISCLPLVSAQSLTEKGFIGISSLIFGNTNSLNEALIKITLFAILFGFFFKGLQQAFPRTSSMSKIIGLLMALISIRLMPEFWIINLGKLLIVSAIILIPFMIINLIFKEWNFLKIAFLIVSYFGIYLLIGGSGFFGLGFWNRFMADLHYYYNVYKFQFIIVISALISYFSLKYLRR